eukprot:COSAG05_NODE_10112_length_582_cov_1.171843_2_plen_50_part_01
MQEENSHLEQYDADDGNFDQRQWSNDEHGAAAGVAEEQIFYLRREEVRAR